MTNESDTFFRLKSHVLKQLDRTEFGKCSADIVKQVESDLGFQLPPILKRCYQEIDNGGFGPGYGIVGLNGGATSDFGNLLETYTQLKVDSESENKLWPKSLLPFCEWGCGIFSCVLCDDSRWMICTCDQLEVRCQDYDIVMFFDMWVSGVSILDHNRDHEIELTQIPNPFTGRTSYIKSPKGPKKP